MRKSTLLLGFLLAMGGTVSAQTNQLTPFIVDNAGVWRVDDVIQLATGDTFKAGPQGYGNDNSGTWTWTLPDKSERNGREITIANVTVANAGIYTVTQKTNTGVVRTHEIKVYVDSKLSADDVLPTYQDNPKADEMYEDFNAAFLYTNPSNKRTYYTEGWKEKYTAKLYCWEQGLNLLMLMDRYRFRGDEAMIPTISKAVDALNAENSGGPTGRNKENGNGMVPKAVHDKYHNLANQQKLSDWTWNEYNDDLLWMSLPNIRAYQITGEKRFLEQAKWTWDYMNERGWDTEMGGGIWWCIWPWTDKDQCKSGLSNNPAICLSAYLYEETGEEKYLKRAKEIFEWVYAVLRNPEGNVDEGISISKNTTYPSRLNAYNVYNQGPFIEGAAALYRITGEERYFNIAKETLDWTIKNKVNNEGIMEFGNKTDGTWQSEFMRGMAFLLETRPELWKDKTYSGASTRATTYYSWLRKNADAAYNTRETAHGLSDCAWDKQTVFLPDNKHSEMWVGSVIAQQVTPAKNPWSGDTFTGVSVEIPEPQVIAPAKGYVKDAIGWKEGTRIGIAPNRSVALRAEADFDGTWSWVGPNGPLSSTANELSWNRFLVTSAGTYTATCTAEDGTQEQVSFLISVQSTETPVITPYVTVGNGWQETDKVDVESGKSFSFGPQVKNSYESDKRDWVWTGPDGFTSNKRQVTVTNASVAKAGIYTVIYTDMFGLRVSKDFEITVDGMSGIEGVDADAAGKPAYVHDLQGRKIGIGEARKGVYIMGKRKVILK